MTAKEIKMNKYKTLMMNSAIFAIGSFGSKILGFLLIRLYTSHMSTDDFGISDIIVKTANLLIPIVTLSVVEAVMRYSLDEKRDKQKIFTIAIYISFAGIAIITLFSPLISQIKYFEGYGYFLFIYLFTSSARAINQQFLRTRGHIKLYSFDGILTVLTMVICNVIFIVVMNLGVVGYLLSIIVSDALSAIFLFVVGQNYRYFRLDAFDKKLAFSMIRYSAPLIPTAVLWWVVSSSDAYMVTHWLGEQANGIYSASYRIPTLISMVSTIFFQAWQMSLITEYKSDDAQDFFSKVFHAYQSVMYLTAGGILLFLRPLMDLMIKNPDYSSAYKYTPFLVVGILMSCLCTFLSYVYAATHHTKNSLFTSLIAAVSNILLNLILIPDSGAGVGVQGAAFATMVSYTACFVVRLFDSRRYIHYKVNFAQTFVNFVLLLVMAIAAVKEFENYIFVILAIYAIIIITNFKAVIQTVKKITHKKI